MKITKAALLLFRDIDGKRELLFAQSKGKSFWVFPGGKQDPGEHIGNTLQRELHEEFGCGAKDVKKLGVVSGKTPDGRDIEMHMYSGVLLGEPVPQAEIESIMWLDKEGIARHTDVMTPLTLEHVLPFLTAEGIW